MNRTQFTGLLRRVAWRPQSQVVALGTLGFFIALILGALYLSQVASEVTTNRELSDLLLQRDELERTNEQLLVEIAQLQSVPRLRAEAQAMGFVDAAPGEIEYLAVEGYFIREVDTVAPLEEEPEEAPVYNETFTDWLGQQLSRLRGLIGG